MSKLNYINSETDRYLNYFDRKNFDLFKKKSFLITGSTGLIGGLFFRVLKYISKTYDLNCNFVLICRNKKKLLNLYSRDELENVEIVEQDLSREFEYRVEADYVLHAASETSSKVFVEDPVKVIKTTINGTTSLLQSSLGKVRKFIYVSSMEVYGTLNSDDAEESILGTVDLTIPRSSYPLSKRLAENICNSYYKNFSFPVIIVRPTLTFGVGTDYSDSRVFAQFARSVLTNQDIILKTRGESQRDYIYSLDLIFYILSLFISGEIGQTYNISNPNTYCSIYDFACLAKSFNSNINIRFDIDEESSKRYPIVQKIRLNCNKIQAICKLEPKSLTYMFNSLLTYYKEPKDNRGRNE